MLVFIDVELGCKSSGNGFFLISYGHFMFIYRLSAKKYQKSNFSHNDVILRNLPF